AIAVVAQERWPHGRIEPRAAHDENVHEAIVVVIGLDTVEAAADLAKQTRFLGAIFKSAVPLVAKVSHRLGRIEGGDDDVEQADVAKVLHDGAAGLVEAVDACLRTEV